MCGIIGYIGKEKASDILIDALKKLEYRGYDSVGIAIKKNKKITVEKTVNRIENLKEILKNKDVEGNIGIGHTRWATHGKPSIENAHPQISQNGNFYVVHNGIIENYKELKNELKEDGFIFKSDTDTEVIPFLIEKYYNGNLLEAVRLMKKRLSGSFSIGIISVLEEKIIAVKNFSPLIIGISKNGKFITSDTCAILKYTKDIIYLKDGEIAVLDQKNVDIYDDVNLKENVKITKIQADEKSAEKGNFNHFMLKEICEQPTVIKNIIKNTVNDGKIKFKNLNLNEEKLKKFKNITVIACGSAYNAGLAAKYFLENVIKINVNVETASEFRYKNSFLNSESLAIIISQSGETADTLAALREAKNKGAYILSVVNVFKSSIANESDSVIYTNAGPEIAVATTKGYLSQIAVLYLFGLWASCLLKTLSEEEIEHILKEFFEIPLKLEKIINEKEKIKEIAKISVNENSVYFIGRNTDYAVALEAALKFKEISYIHAEAYAAGELKHGSIALIEDNTKVIASAFNKETQEKTLNNIKEVKARGATVILFTAKENKNIENEVDYIFYLPNTEDLLSPLLSVIPFQFLAYYTALIKGFDIDKPRNLAKSVTVE